MLKTVPAGSTHELEEPGPSFTVHNLDKGPEPLDLLAGLGVVAVDGVPLPVLHVDLLHTTQHQLQLPLVKVLQPLQGNHLVETVQESLRRCIIGRCEKKLLKAKLKKNIRTDSFETASQH